MARSEELLAVVDELGDWARGPGPLFRQLSRAIAAAVERGAIEHGARLPAERPLAEALSIGRGTAVAAYDLLVADGVVERRAGSGTFALGPVDLGLPPGREGTALVARLVERSAVSDDVIDLSISVLRSAERLPAASVSSARLATVAPDTGYSPWGLPGLRAAIAGMVEGWGLPSTAEQVVVTTGAQQAISTAAACWIRAGDAVVVEDPTYPGAISAFAAAGARLVGIGVDRHGARPDDLRRALAQRPALVYLSPNVHSPTGTVLAASRRREIAELVTAARVPLVEDHALAGLTWQQPPAPIAALRPDAPIAVIGSLSKTFWGGLRVGFVRAPAPVALRFARVKATHDLGSSAVSQVLAEELLTAGNLDAHLDRHNRELRDRCDALAEALHRRLPSWSWVEPAGGLSLWVRLPAPVAVRFAQLALRCGVAVATAESLSPGSGHQDRVRLSFAAPVDELVEGVDRLALAWSRITTT